MRASSTDCYLTENLTDEQGIGHLSRPATRVLLLVLGLEDDIGHGHEVVLISITDEGEAGAKDREYVAQRLFLFGDLGAGIYGAGIGLCELWGRRFIQIGGDKTIIPLVDIF